MISQGSLGNLGVYLIHPPKLCARLVQPASKADAVRPAHILGGVDEIHTQISQGSLGNPENQ